MFERQYGDWDAYRLDNVEKLYKSSVKVVRNGAFTAFIVGKRRIKVWLDEEDVVKDALHRYIRHRILSSKLPIFENICTQENLDGDFAISDVVAQYLY